MKEYYKDLRLGDTFSIFNGHGLEKTLKVTNINEKGDIRFDSTYRGKTIPLILPAREYSPVHPGIGLFNIEQRGRNRVHLRIEVINGKRYEISRP